MRLTIAIAALVAASPALAQDKAAGIGAQLDEDKLICKRQVETGSLVRAKKTCMTRRDWRDQMLNAQNDTRQAILPVNTQAPQ